MQLDPAPWPGEPFPHELGMMIASVVEKDMDEHEHRIERLDRFQETNRRGGVDGQGLDHLGLAGLQIDRAVNVDALTPARLFNRELLLARRPAADGPRGMGWVHRVREHHRFVVRQGIQQLIVALDECLLLLFVELARNDVRLVILEPQTMQKRDQSPTLFGLYPFLQKLFADGGYQGPVFQKPSAKLLPHLEIEIVKRSDHAKGFELLPRRWVVERTFAWFNRCRRLAKDFENLTRNALAFLRLASIRLMLRKLCLS